MEEEGGEGNTAVNAYQAHASCFQPRHKKHMVQAAKEGMAHKVAGRWYRRLLQCSACFELEHTTATATEEGDDSDPPVSCLLRETKPRKLHVKTV